MLTDEELMEIRNRAKLNSNRQIDPLPFARDVIKAVLAKAGEQEPKWYIENATKEVFSPSEHNFLLSAGTFMPDEFDPLYAHPLPAQAIPNHVGIGQVCNSDYARGWNDCVDIMLSASTKP